LKHYDYSNAGAYFITLCIQDRQYLLGHIQEGVAVLSDIGRIAQEQWFNLPHRFTNVRLDAFVVMPNHIHGILFIDPVGAPYGRPQGSPLQAGAPDDAHDRPYGRPQGSPLQAGAPDDIAGNQQPHDRPQPTGDRVGAPLAGAPDDTHDRPYGRPQGSPLQAVVGAYKSLVHRNALLMAKRNGLFLGHLWQRNYWEHVVRNDEELNRIREYIRNNPHTWEEDRLYKMNLTAAANVAGILGE
jgi:REP element-mobilizing transposase RayT